MRGRAEIAAVGTELHRGPCDVLFFPVEFFLRTVRRAPRRGGAGRRLEAAWACLSWREPTGHDSFLRPSNANSPRPRLHAVETARRLSLAPLSCYSSSAAQVTGLLFSRTQIKEPRCSVKAQTSVEKVSLD
ncbi:unnamed protein product [Pleuronectes platessa]|uniref:Uncharacterized protein n=1 Tax=Pleuronectes platessa TaxID=8262 RepID=A0A9N7VJT4_PLEPL|nr:unnamed protein product [Pleuronectes platessa]